MVPKTLSFVGLIIKRYNRMLYIYLYYITAYTITVQIEGVHAGGNGSFALFMFEYFPHQINSWFGLVGGGGGGGGGHSPYSYTMKKNSRRGELREVDNERLRSWKEESWPYWKKQSPLLIG